MSVTAPPPIRAGEPAPGPVERIGAAAFRKWLALIAVGALVLRVGAAFFYDARTTVGGDAVWYTGVARLVAGGHGFVEPLHFALGERIETAAHPPLYTLYLSVVNLLGSDSTLLHRLWSCLPGVAAVVMFGLIGREIADRRTGLVAAALGAVFLELVTQDVMLWSEGFYALMVALMVFASYRYLRTPDLLHAGVLSGLVALATLTRAEAALLFLVLVVPLVLRQRDQPWKRRFGTLVVAALVALVVMAPWVAYNNNGRFEHPVTITVTFGTLIGSANCAGSYYGGNVGGWGGLCRDTLPGDWPRDESVAEQRARKAGFGYISDHVDRLAVVIPARLARTFGFWAPVRSISDDLMLGQAGIHWAAYVVFAQYWAYLALGVAGAVALFRRRVALLPLLSPVVVVAVITVIGYGTMRFRIALDAVLPVLAAVAVSQLLDRRRRPRTTLEPTGRVASER
jgi:4-amino-4-deoxy-L-arabinose transferase-like glycosyltransferase